MADTNLFQELKDVLQDFKEFLDQNVPIIKPAITAVAEFVPQINELVNSLVSLLTDLKTEIQNLDVGIIQNLDKVGEFTTGVSTLLESAKTLLPDQASAIDEVLDIARIASSLPSIDQVKTEIINLLDAVIAHLNSLKSS